MFYFATMNSIMFLIRGILCQGLLAHLQEVGLIKHAVQYE